MSFSKTISFLFPVVGSLICGLLAVIVMVTLIRKSESVHAFSKQPVPEFFESPRLHTNSKFSQTVEIPQRFDGRPFILALFFGRIHENSTGRVSVTLSQGLTIQNQQTRSLHRSLQASLIKQERLRFEGFKGGPAQLTISGLGDTSPSSPSLIYLLDEQSPPLRGTGIPQNATAYIDWYFVMEGQEKLQSAFSPVWSSFAWFLPFIGIIAIAIMGLKPGEGF
tara:strand:- start:10600 stop:11265 length:666 start_codon:yes stop_codon:yes gene_type:complete